MAVKEISPFDFNESPFRVIGKDWLLVTGEYEIGRASCRERVCVIV